MCRKSQTRRVSLTVPENPVSLTGITMEIPNDFSKEYRFGKRFVLSKNNEKNRLTAVFFSFRALESCDFVNFFLNDRIFFAFPIGL